MSSQYHTDFNGDVYRTCTSWLFCFPPRDEPTTIWMNNLLLVVHSSSDTRSHSSSFLPPVFFRLLSLPVLLSSLNFPHFSSLVFLLLSNRLSYSSPLFHSSLVFLLGVMIGVSSLILAFLLFKFLHFRCIFLLLLSPFSFQFFHIFISFS